MDRFASFFLSLIGALACAAAGSGFLLATLSDLAYTQRQAELYRQAMGAGNLVFISAPSSSDFLAIGFGAMFTILALGASLMLFILAVRALLPDKEVSDG